MTDVKVLAELGQTCGNDVELHREMLRDVARAGAWGVKVQVIDPSKIATADAPAYWHDPTVSNQRVAFAQWGSLTFTGLQQVRAEARKLNLAFVATPFDLDAVDMLVALDVDAIKIASGDMVWHRLLERAAETGRPLIVSTGASYVAEISAAMRVLNEYEPVTWLACSLEYPTPHSNANIARVGELAKAGERQAPRVQRYWQYGYSDHTHGVGAAAVAVGCGATMLEKHVSPLVSAADDDSFAVDTAGLGLYVDRANEAAMLLGDPTLAPHDGELPARVGARRSMYYADSINERQQQINDRHAVALRPAGPGISPNEYDDLGRSFQVQLHAAKPGAPILRDDIIR